MKKCSLNEQLEISYPDSFTPLKKSEIMTDDKTIKAKWGVKDSGGELYIYIGWTGRLGLIGSLFITQRGILRKFEKSCKRFLSDYSRGQSIQKKVFDKSAAGFAFSGKERGSGIEMTGEMITVRLGGRIYFFKYITDNKDSFYCRQSLDLLISSISLKAQAN